MHVSLSSKELADTLDMEVYDCLLPCMWFEEGEVIGIGHEEILGEDSWAEGVARM